MKRIFASFVLISFFLLTGCNNAVAGDSDGWQEKLEPALKTAKAENKAVLINFTGSDWCPWCKKLMTEVFTQDDFKTYAEKNLVLVKIDFPRNLEQSDETKYYNNMLAQKYKIRGFPTIILLDSNGKLVAQTGYQPGGAANYVIHLKSLL